VVQVVEDVQGLLPVVFCSGLVTGGVADVAEVSEELGFVVAVAEFADDGEGAAMAVGRLGEVA
jgi:hypothetical protein